MIKEELFVPVIDGSGLGLNEGFLELVREIQKSKECGGNLTKAVWWAIQEWCPDLEKKVWVLLVDGVFWAMLQLDPTLVSEFGKYLAKDQSKALLERIKTISELQRHNDNLK